MSADLGIIGLGVMSENLVLNLSEKGIKVAVYNRTSEKLKEFVKRFPDINVIPCYNLDEFVSKIKSPRKIMLLIKAGHPVDEILDALLPRLEKGDVVMDAGNSHFKDTERRFLELKKHGIYFMGMGISGGVEGARKGLSIMVGGDEEAYFRMVELLNSISSSFASRPSHGFFGKGGAGHFVKAVHNGIEYALIEHISEVYFLLKALGKKNPEIIEIFESWKKEGLNSFLLSAASNVLKAREGESYLVDLILDKAEQKGTGKWAVEISLELGTPSPSISAAVMVRLISSFKERRVNISKILSLRREMIEVFQDFLIPKALFLANLSSYLQGLDLLRNAKFYGYSFDLKDVMRVWLGGSIIRSDLLAELYHEKVEGDIMLSDFVVKKIKEGLDSLANLVSFMAKNKLPSLVISSSYQYLINFSHERLPANMTQALRDYFGAHGFERIDKEGEFHYVWL